MSAVANPIDRLRELGGEVFLDGGRLKYRIPDTPEANEVIEEIRQNREAIREMLSEQASKPPSLEEVRAILPPGVKVASYAPKQTPFAVAPVSIVTTAGKFYRTYLKDLAWRLKHPQSYAAPPLADILAKLADAGLLVELGGEFYQTSPQNRPQTAPEGSTSE
jgi:hypothetical protein